MKDLRDDGKLPCVLSPNQQYRLILGRKIDVALPSNETIPQQYMHSLEHFMIENANP
jgi:hypothetical protein